MSQQAAQHSRLRRTRTFATPTNRDGQSSSIFFQTSCFWQLSNQKMRGLCRMLAPAACLLLSASVRALGMTRGSDGSVSLLAPGQKEMQCEEGCSFQPFCLPDMFAEDAATEPVVCTDETWESCKTMKEACPDMLRTEMCADAKGVICKERIGVEVFDREAQAAERAALDEAERKAAEHRKPTKAKKCMSMAAPNEEEWCTVTCDFDAASCADAKLCSCSSFDGLPSDGAGRESCDIACACAVLPDAKCLPD
jgi:hypothetical protein